MSRPPRAHFRGLFRAAIIVAILGLAFPFALTLSLARPATRQLAAVSLVMAIARIGNEERFATMSSDLQGLALSSRTFHLITQVKNLRYYPNTWPKNRDATLK